MIPKGYLYKAGSSVRFPVVSNNMYIVMCIVFQIACDASLIV